MRTKSVVLVFCLFLFSCSSTWSLIQNNDRKIEVERISMLLPQGWLIFNDHLNGYRAWIKGKKVNTRILKRVILTRDGLLLDLIDIMCFNLVNAFPSIEKQASESTLPSELAARYVAEQKVISGVDNLQVVENSPVSIAGTFGFKVVLKYKNTQGLSIVKMTYGFVTANNFYTVSYRAPSLHFYDANLPSYLEMIKTVDLIS